MRSIAAALCDDDEDEPEALDGATAGADDPAVLARLAQVRDWKRSHRAPTAAKASRILAAPAYR